MIVPGSVNPLLLATGGYDVPYSLRFRASNSAYVSRTFGSPTSSSIWTFSVWVKRGLIASTRYLLGASTTTNFGFNSSDQLTLTINGVTACTSTAVFRDPTAWMHVVYQQNGSAQTIYVNGSSVATGTTAAAVFNTAIAHQIGAANTANYFDGHMAEVNFIDGQALTPSSFGQTDSATGVWVPKKYSGTYGNNGFYLKFADASAATAAAIGKDSSGNGNNWTPSGISVTSGVTFDQMTDTPTLNYPVLNPLDLSGTTGTYSAANLNYTKGTAGNAQAYNSITMSSGKWYCEVTMGADIAEFVPGIIAGSANAGANRYLGQDTFTYAYYYDGRKINAASFSAYGNSYVAGDVIGIILDADNGKLYFSKNGTVQNSGDPVAGTNAAFTGLTGPYRFAVSSESGGIGDFNFGQRAFSYTPPSGFKALNTQNIASAAVTTSGSFTGNAAADGPFIWANGNPATLTINGNAVTFGTHADKTAGGFKLRTSSTSYNTSGTNNWTATAGKRFVQSKKPNNAQVNP